MRTVLNLVGLSILSFGSLMAQDSTVIRLDTIYIHQPIDTLSTAFKILGKWHLESASFRVTPCTQRSYFVFKDDGAMVVEHFGDIDTPCTSSGVAVVDYFVVDDRLIVNDYTRVVNYKILAIDEMELKLQQPNGHTKTYLKVW